uniref:DUF1499 domain-containing protein n=1 Tax=Zooxanthella nutricula TaxID=1333877 RepID=A0A6U6WR93_9DINO
MAPQRSRARGIGSLVVAAVAAQAALWIAAAPAAFAAAGAASRRGLLMASVATGALAGPGLASAVQPCKDGANNCFSSASPKGKNYASPWTWPAGTSKAEAIVALKSVLAGYPKQGQSEVDQGGWSFAVDELDSKGYARLEYLSGIGNFARFFNGGKPFVDDLEVSVGDAEVSVRSSSRVGDSDLGVNAKRLNYIAAALRAKGWAAPAIAA